MKDITKNSYIHKLSLFQLQQLSHNLNNHISHLEWFMLANLPLLYDTRIRYNNIEIKDDLILTEKYHILIGRDMTKDIIITLPVIDNSINGKEFIFILEDNNFKISVNSSAPNYIDDGISTSIELYEHFDKMRIIASKNNWYTF